MSNPYLKQIEKSSGFVDMAVKAVGKLGASAIGGARKVMANPTVNKAVGMATRNPMRTAVGAGALATGAGALMARPSQEKQASANIYIEKIAKALSEENKQVAKTFALQTAVGFPAHAAGMAAGGYAGAKLIEPKAAGFAKKFPRMGKGLGLSTKGGGKAIGVAAGMMAMGALGDIAALKHSLKGKVKE